MKTYELIEQASNTIRCTVEMMGFSATYPAPLSQQALRKSMSDCVLLLKQAFAPLELAVMLVKEGEEKVL